jgi:hypothetical protein
MIRNIRIYSARKVRYENNLDLRTPRLSRTVCGKVASKSVDHRGGRTQWQISGTPRPTKGGENE